jgi:hypothetical protein
MQKRQIGCIFLIIFIFFLTNNLNAELADESRIRREVTSAFTGYRLALKIEDYAWAFSFEPSFIQEAAGDVETYKKWWSGTPEADEYRRLYSEMIIKKVEILTPKRAAILIYPPDKRVANAAFYVFLKDGRWKVGCFEHLFRHTKRDLEKLKGIIIHYYKENKRLPEKLSELIPDYIKELPLDLFNDKMESYRYMKREDKDFIIYSFGPDSDDDLGKIKYDYYKNGLLSNGDIIIEGSVSKN